MTLHGRRSKWRKMQTDHLGHYTLNSPRTIPEHPIHLPPSWVPLRSQASGAGCRRGRAPTYAQTTRTRAATGRRPAHTRPQRPHLRQRGQRLGVRKQRQRWWRRRRRGWGRGRDALPGPSGPVEVQLEGGGPREAEQSAPEPWSHFREGGRDLQLTASQ